MEDKKRFTIYWYILIWIIAAGIGIYFRLYPLINYVPNASEEKATVFVLTRLRAAVANQINFRYPYLNAGEKRVLAKKMFDELLHKEGGNARKAIERLSKQLDKSGSNNKQKFPYLLASDSFYYYDLTENIINTGKLSDSVKGNKFLNKKMLAPYGYWVPITLHPYIGYLVHKILLFFEPNIKLMYSVSFTPLIIVALSLIPFLCVCRILECSIPASLSGAIFFTLSPIYIKRSMFGWYDNDPYNTLFPLIILALLFVALKQDNQNKKNIIIYSTITAFILLIYNFFWQGWVFMFGVIIISGVIISIINLYFEKYKPRAMIYVIFFAAISIATFIAISITFGISSFFNLFSEGWKALKNFISPHLSLWPDVYISVGELKSISYTEIISQTGGWIFFLIASYGIIFSLFKATISRKYKNMSIYITVLIFLIASFIITKGAQRFAMLCLTPLAISFPLGIDRIRESIISIFKTDKKYTHLTNGIMNIVIISLCFLPIKKLHTSIETLMTPIFNDTWNAALTNIKINTPKNSIINTWWPPGHFIKAIANRRVTFDGATINFPQAYWMANIFLAQNEKQALGIIRMLNCSANKAAEFLQSKNIPLSSCIQILKTITQMKAKQAQQYLNTKTFLNDKDIKYLLKLTHGQPPPSYLLIYNELIKNNLQFKFIGNWNFKAVEAINKNKNALKKIPDRNSKEYMSFLWYLAGGPSKYSGPLALLGKSKDILIFEHGIRINIKTKECVVSSEKFGKGIPFSILYTEGNKIVEIKQNNSNLNFSVILYKNSDNDNYNVVLLDTPLAHSLLMRLFFFRGKGLKYFKAIDYNSDLTKRTEIITYKVDWDKFLNND